MNRRIISLVALLSALLALMAIRAPNFFRIGQLTALLTITGPLLVVCCGMATVILARQIDISIGSQFAICSIVLGLLARAHWPLPAAAAAAVACGACLGAINGMFIAWLGLPSIVVTLATMVGWREGVRWWRQGEFVSGLPPHFQWFGLGQRGGEAALLAISAAVFLLSLFFHRYTAAGRWFYAVGSNSEAARLAGISPQKVTFAAFAGMGTITGLAAVLNAIRYTDVDPNTGAGLELQAIAAVVIGGVSIAGGRGSLPGVLLGVLLLVLISPVLVFLKLPPQWEKAVQGLLILSAVAADAWNSRARKTNSIRRGDSTRVQPARG